MRRAPLVSCVAASPLLLFAAPAAATTSVFRYTGGQQTFRVPAGVRRIHVVEVGARGGSSDGGVAGSSRVAKVTADLTVTPGELLYIEVGGRGKNGFGGEDGAGGFNGGGSSQTGTGGGGGGASDVRTVSRPAGDSPGSLASRLIVAGGTGGGGAFGPMGNGGAGGGAAGPGGNGEPGEDGLGPSSGGGGLGGTQTSGGMGGPNGDSGRGGDGQLGLGGDGTDNGDDAFYGGGGGAGYFGGGAGGATADVFPTTSLGGGGGGGGGSSFLAPTATGTSLGMDASGVPSVTLTYTPSTGGGGSGGSGGSTSSFGAKTLVTLKLAATRIPAHGPLRVRVSNANGFVVEGRLSGQTTRKVSVSRKRRVKLKAKRFSVLGQAAKTVKLRLPRSLRKLLARKHKLSLRLTAKLTDPAGKVRTVRKTVKPRLRRKRRR